MSILATCQCGASFRAKPELAGKRVKCPSCGHPFSVPRPEAAAAPIRVACRCGQAFQAKPELAGRRVKCPACGQPLTIPHPAGSHDADPLGVGDSSADPLGLGSTSDDPLGLGNTGADPLGVGEFPTGGTLPSPPTAPTSVQAQHVSPKQRRRQLKTAAGYVAVGYGGFQVILCVGLVAFALLQSGLAADVYSIGSNSLFAGLGAWLAIMGLGILKDEPEALARAGQASTIYAVFTVFNLAFLGFFLVMSLAAARFPIVLLIATLANVVYLLPPAFILYVGSLYSKD